MENWIGAYRLPNQTASLGVDRGGGGGGGGEGSLEGGVSPIPGSTPSPNLLNMWNHAIKVETSSHGLPGSHPNNQGGSIKGEIVRIVFSISCGGRRLSSSTRTNLFCGREKGAFLWLMITCSGQLGQGCQPRGHCPITFYFVAPTE